MKKYNIDVEDVLDYSEEDFKDFKVDETDTDTTDSDYSGDPHSTLITTPPSNEDYFSVMNDENWRSENERESARGESARNRSQEDKMKRVRSYRKNSRESFNSVADRYKISE